MSLLADVGKEDRTVTGRTSHRHNAGYRHSIIRYLPNGSWRAMIEFSDANMTTRLDTKIRTSTAKPPRSQTRYQNNGLNGRLRHLLWFRIADNLRDKTQLSSAIGIDSKELFPLIETADSSFTNGTAKNGIFMVLPRCRSHR